MSQSFKELIKYGIVGGIGLIVDWGTFFLFRDLFGINYVVSHIMASVLAILNNFVLNSRYTFQATDDIFKRAISFFAIAGVGLAISSSLLPSIVRLYNIYLEQYIHIDSQKVVQNLVRIFVTIVVAGIQFFANKYVTFRKKGE